MCGARALRARKRFGQHFLVDEHVVADIVAAVAPRQEDHLLEIGAGTGALTSALYGLSGRLTLVEIDRDLVPRLRQRFPAAEVICADILDTPLASVASTPMRIVGNLPYNISTPLLVKLLSETGLIIDMHFMLQKEVAERLSASPGNKDWGRLSVLMQYMCDVDLLFHVGPDSFDPPPEVWSSVVRLRPRVQTERPLVDEKSFDRVLRAVFSQRRKQLGNNLKGLAPASVWESVRPAINLRDRAESVSLEQFIAMANTLACHEEDMK